MSKKLLSAAFLSALLFSAAMPGTAMAKQTKYLVCHFDANGDGRVVQIGVPFSESGHYDHDDPGDYVSTLPKGDPCF